MNTNLEIALAAIIYIFLVLLITYKGRKKQIGQVLLFLITFFLTPIVGIIIILEGKNKFHYHVTQYKCRKCGYHFSEKHKECPHCANDGHHVKLIPVDKIMT